MAEVKRAAPDGYTLILGHVGTAREVNPALFGKKLPYDPNADFAPVTLVAKVPNVIAVSSKSPYLTIADFVADARILAKSISDPRAVAVQATSRWVLFRASRIRADPCALQGLRLCSPI